MRVNFSHYLRLAALVLALNGSVALIVLGIAQLGGWNTLTQFSNGFFGAGMSLIVIGILSAAGGFAQRADFKMTYSASAGSASLAERTQRMVADAQQGYGFLILMASAGVVLIIVSILIGQFVD
jgi:hypothetical protein